MDQIKGKGAPHQCVRLKNLKAPHIFNMCIFPLYQSVAEPFIRGAFTNISPLVSQCCSTILHPVISAVPHHEIWWPFRPLPFSTTPNKQSIGCCVSVEDSTILIKKDLKPQEIYYGA